MTSNDNIIDFKAFGEKKAQESNLTIANLYEVQDDTHDDCTPALMGYMIEIDKFMVIQVREATAEDIAEGDTGDEDGFIMQSVVLTQKQLQFISSYASTFYLIEDLDEISE
jgi:hypothetical protein